MEIVRNDGIKLSPAELSEAYDAYMRGTDLGRLAARYSVYPAELRRVLDCMAEERAAERKLEERGAPDHMVTRLNAALFGELKNLEIIDPRDHDLLKAEVSRSQQVESIARAIIENGHLALRVVEVKARITQEVTSLPKMLEV